MKKQKKLLFARNIFFFLIMIAFTVIIMSEKKETILIPKITDKINQYIEENYNKDNFNLGKVQYNNQKYSMKISSKENKKRYFYIYYSKKKITDTYQEDFIQGKSILSTIQKNIQKEIETKLKNHISVEITTTLDQFTESVQERIIKEDNLLELKIYNIKEEIIISNWNEKDITKTLETYLLKYKEHNINPKYFIITITDNQDITKSIEISNITLDFPNNQNKETIISDIINDNNSSLLKSNIITYKYKN